LQVDVKDNQVRLLQSAGNSSTSRITPFLEFKLKTISVNFCKNGTDEFCQDSCQYIGYLLNCKDCLIKTLGIEKQKFVFYIVPAVAKALYPNFCRETMNKALVCALE